MNTIPDPKRETGSAGVDDAIDATAENYAEALHLDPDTARLAAADVEARGDRKPSSDAIEQERAERARATQVRP